MRQNLKETVFLSRKNINKTIKKQRKILKEINESIRALGIDRTIDNLKRSAHYLCTGHDNYPAGIFLYFEGGEYLWAEGSESCPLSLTGIMVGSKKI